MDEFGSPWVYLETIIFKEPANIITKIFLTVDNIMIRGSLVHSSQCLGGFIDIGSIRSIKEYCPGWST